MIRDVETFPPVFMFGMERSGTTLLSMMVGAHPEIAVPLSTTGMWYQFQAQLDNYSKSTMGLDLKRLINDILSHERIKLWDAQLSQKDVLAALKGECLEDCLLAFHASYAHKKGKPYWASMDIAHMDHVSLLNQWFPDARFIHIIRDPRDVALSYRGYRYGSSNMLECAQNWTRGVEGSLREGAVLGSERYYVLRYEDLILKPEDSLKNLCDFLGVAYAPQMLEYGEMVSQKVPNNKRDLWPILDQKPQADKVERWRRELNSAQCAIIEDWTKDLLSKLNYPISIKGNRPFLSFLLELWYFADRGGRFNRLIKRQRPVT